MLKTKSMGCYGTQTEYVYDKAQAILNKIIAVSDSRMPTAAKQSEISQNTTERCLLSPRVTHKNRSTHKQRVMHHE